jgi:hypothetical protein
MGMKLFSDGVAASPNPDPDRFTILDSKEFGDESNTVTVLEVHYPGCTTHGGKKVLVFQGKVSLDVARLDPHFLDDGERSPIARFPANYEGRRDAAAFAKMKTK